MDEVSICARQFGSNSEDPNLVPHAARTDALDAQPCLDWLGKGDRVVVATERLDDNADRVATRRIEDTLLD